MFDPNSEETKKNLALLRQSITNDFGHIIFNDVKPKHPLSYWVKRQKRKERQYDEINKSPESFARFIASYH